jgi:hypothetical protein
MTDSNEQLRLDAIASRTFNVPPWFWPRFARISGYSMDSNNAFQRAAFAIDKPAFGNETVADKDAARWQSIILGHGLVALCSTLESLVRDTLTDWLAYTPAAWRVDRVAKLKPTIGEWYGKDTAAQARWVMTEIWKTSGGPDRNPVSRFESLFEAFNIPRVKMDSLIPAEYLQAIHYDDMPRLIGELSAMRNVIVHQLGVVDKKFCEDCSHLPYVEGQELLITFVDYARYSSAVNHYLLEVFCRVAAAYGATAEPPPDTTTPGE